MSARELARSASITVTHDYESASVHSSAGWQLHVGEFYGDPQVALIDANARWCAVAGEGLIVCELAPQGRCTAYFREPGNALWITELRQEAAWVLEARGEDGCWHRIDLQAP
ncbi:hypothetical protein [Janthinobacterium aquaticum]|uniref:hypothetical protein n=1 Tax=Janthinobacterium sp. FT58W TaxID=2654254 RepID=UPI0012641F53|nr:hypothetical protein [Janthinobacterium sp. FT58W]KAB8037345.1 hypothetical protein GCM43_23320 [Janthinobacterium sp. FT58W]